MKQIFRFRGAAVRFEVVGRGDPVVLVHGTPWSSYNLRHLAARLSRRHRVYTYDMLGYGQSDKPDGDVSLATQGRLLRSLLDHWELSDAVVVGHDFGGTATLRATLLEGAAVSAMVLIAPVVLRPWGSRFFSHVRAHTDMFRSLPDYAHAALVSEYIRSAAHHEMDAATLERTVAPWLDRAGRHGFYRQIAQAQVGHTDEVVRLLGSITTPTMVLWGEADRWLPVDRAHRLTAMIPGAELRTVPDAGHLVIEEAPDALCDTIEEFVARRRQPSPTSATLSLPQTSSARSGSRSPLPRPRASRAGSTSRRVPCAD